MKHFSVYWYLWLRLKKYKKTMTLTFMNNWLNGIVDKKQLN